MHLLKGVSSAGEVTLIYPTKNEGTDPDLEILRPLCRRVFTFPESSLAARRDSRLPRIIYWLIHKLRYLHPTRSAHMQQHWSKEGNALVATLCSERFDLVWAERITSIQMLPKSLGCRIIIDLDDLEHRRLRWWLRLGKIHHMTFFSFLEFLKLRRLERGLGMLPYEFSVCSEIDRKALGVDKKVWVVPNGTELPSETERLTPGALGRVLLFVGSMSYEPNEDAAVFFAKRVLPLVRRELPDAKFFIVGRAPTQTVSDLHDGRSVFVSGEVQNLKDYFCGASAVVAPIRFGGGTRIKILEAMAYHKPVISTCVGAEGLEVESGKHLLLADSPREFARGCITLLKDASLCKRIGDQGFRLVRDQYQWSTIENKIREIISNWEHVVAHEDSPGRPLH